MRKVLILLFLTGCASVTPHSEHDIYYSLQGFNGRNIQEVVSRFGLPDSQRQMFGNQVYRWNANREWRTTTPVSSTTTGTIGNAVLGQVPYSQTTTSERVDVREWRCVLDVGVDTNNIVRKIGFNGNMGACQLFFVGSR